jgi:hypothetical protein
VSRAQRLSALAWSRWCAPHGSAPRCSSFPRGPRNYTLAALSLAHVAPLRGLTAALPVIQRSSGIQQEDSQQELASSSAIRPLPPGH